MNRFVKPHGGLVVTILITAALLTSRHCPALAGPPRVFRVIYNQDCTDLFGHVPMQGQAITPNDIDRMVDEVAEGGAELMLINPNGQIGRVNYPSRVWQPSGTNRGNRRRAGPNEASGRRGTRLSCPFAGQVRGRGMDVGVSLRMNDTHETPWPDRPVHSDFWRAHPEWWIKAPYRRCWCVSRVFMVRNIYRHLAGVARPILAAATFDRR